MEEKSFVGYEYTDITVVKGMETLWSDSMSNFGWLLEGSSSADIHGINKIVLKFKRNRTIRNKAELTRLQRKFEACIKEIEVLEKSKTIGAATVAYVLGVVGTAFMAGSVFSFTSGMVAFSVVLAMPGFVGWIIPYLVYEKIKKNKSKNVEPMIDSQYDLIYETCEKANRLL